MIHEINNNDDDNNQTIRDRMMDAIDAKDMDGLKECLLHQYVFMACFDENPHKMAFNEGMRELAASICGVNKEVHEWLMKVNG